MCKLYLIPFLHQTTTKSMVSWCVSSCILFHFYIKPQLPHALCIYLSVVSYSISTSNHNFCLRMLCRTLVVSYSISTSNHNNISVIRIRKPLYLIPFLHQTTTRTKLSESCESCILFHFYIKPQPDDCQLRCWWRCILFHFYIKPQHKQ